MGKEQLLEEKETFEYNKKFAERVKEIEKINNLLKNIAEKVYCENIEIFIEIKDAQGKFFTEKNIFNNYESYSKYLNNILSNIINIQTKYYKDKKKQLQYKANSCPDFFCGLRGSKIDRRAYIKLVSFFNRKSSNGANKFIM